MRSALGVDRILAQWSADPIESSPPAAQLGDAKHLAVCADMSDSLGGESPLYNLSLRKPRPCRCWSLPRKSPHGRSSLR
jgi:hypothetical protein